MQEVWRCEGDNVSLPIQKDFKRLKGEDLEQILVTVDSNQPLQNIPLMSRMNL